MDSKRLEDLIAGDKLSVVMFYSPKCSHCRSMIPVFNSISDEVDANFGRVNVLMKQQTSLKHGVKDLPTFKFYCKEQEIGEMIGEIYPALLKNTIKDIIRYKKECNFRRSRVIEIDGYA